MAGADHSNLLELFPGAVTAECDGAGWVTVTGPGGHVVGAECPVCLRGQVQAAAFAFLPPRFRESAELPAPAAAWAAQGARAGGLYLTGQVGTGKTHTAWAAVAAWCVHAGIIPHRGGRQTDYRGGARYGPSVVFTRMTDLLDDLRPGDDARQRVRDCQEAKLLALDDVGAEKASEWTQERLYSIVDHRYAECLPLIVTSNIPPAKLAEQAGERVASRLAEMCTVVPMTGTDRRRPAA